MAEGAVGPRRGNQEADVNLFIASLYMYVYNLSFTPSTLFMTFLFLDLQ